LRKDLFVLASDDLGGRGAGYPGELVAARYAAHSFADSGLEPLGDDGPDGRSYLQAFMFYPQRPPEPGATLTSHNVLGLLRGSDPRLRKQIVVVGAHHDGQGQIGEADPDRSPPRHGTQAHTIWNSADDNASSVVTVLALARALKKSGLRGRRSILFATFGAEEHGLLGSVYYVGHPPLSWCDHVAMLTFEQMGREPQRDPIVMAAGTSTSWRDVLSWANGLTGRHVSILTDEVIQDTDHYGFAVRGVPALAMGVEVSPDAHQNTDTADKIDYGALATRARYALAMLLWLADTPSRPAFSGVPPCTDAKLGKYLSVRCSERSDPGLQTTLLTGPERMHLGVPSDAMPLKVMAVVQGMPAADAGLRPGDIIVEINGHRLTGDVSSRAVQEALKKEGTAVRLHIARIGAYQDVEIGYRIGARTRACQQS
jgi:hypothetical protein